MANGDSGEVRSDGVVLVGQHPPAPKGIALNGHVKIPYSLAIFLITTLVAIVIWGIRLEGRLNTLQELQKQEITERRLTTVDAQDVLQRVSRLEGKLP